MNQYTVEPFDSAADQYGSYDSNITDNLKDVASDAWDKIKDTSKDLWDNIKQTGKQAMNDIKSDPNLSPVSSVNNDMPLSSPSINRPNPPNPRVNTSSKTSANTNSNVSAQSTNNNNARNVLATKAKYNAVNSSPFKRNMNYPAMFLLIILIIVLITWFVTSRKRE